MRSKCATRSAPRRRLVGGLAALALLAGCASARPPHPRAVTDVAAVIDGAAAGDPAPLAGALAGALGRVHGAQAALLRARLAALRLDRAGAERALGTYFAAHDTDPRRQAIAWATRGEAAFAAGDYAAAATAIEAWQRLPRAGWHAGEEASMAQTLTIARLLRAQPRQAVIGGTPGTVATSRDRVGLVRATVRVNGVAQDAVLDTGANLPVVAASTAGRLGLRILDGGGSVASVTARQVTTRVAIADRLDIAGVTLAHVVFLVMDDSQLSFPVAGGYRIGAIIGFPVFRALGRVRFDNAGGFAAGRAAGPALDADNLRVSGNDLYVLARVGGFATALHLDTGAGRSGLTSRFAMLHPFVATLPTGSDTLMGAGGGAVARHTAIWRQVGITIGARSLTLPELAIATDAPKGQDEDRLGNIGQDVLGAFGSYTIDFDRMGFALGPPRG
ncbi:retropepsin-like aspartic protease family protein [Novacetimonas pomaceti]|uniref:retropepsin-like aspartic protease family protein n=1 Tax=Novacetimonas pomaceti TaxID=2021998 RepID=UPI001C2D9261|nr:retropepsin-like aspartic protease [Novacetimonas pomaceti]MBV1835243.1 retroviral-like aspartic protease family protein [Novacetimonas pomaceti]